MTFILFSCILSNRYLLVECNEGKDIKEGAMYLNVMRRFSQALMKVGVRQMKNYKCKGVSKSENLVQNLNCSKINVAEFLHADLF